MSNLYWGLGEHSATIDELPMTKPQFKSRGSIQRSSAYAGNYRWISRIVSSRASAAWIVHWQAFNILGCGTTYRVSLRAYADDGIAVGTIKSSAGN